jgi:hypothetical protein
MTKLLAESGALRALHLNSKPRMKLTATQLAQIRTAALTIYLLNMILAGFFVGLMADPDRDTALPLTCLAGALLWALGAFVIAQKARLPRLRPGTRHDAFGDIRACDGIVITRES